MSERPFPLPQNLVDDHIEVVTNLLDGAEQATPQTTGSEEPPERPTWKVWAYLALVTLTAVACIAVFAPNISGHGWQGLVTLAFLALIFERVGVRIYGNTTIYLGAIALIAIGILYGPAGAAMVAPGAVFGAALFTSALWYRRLFDMGSYTVYSTATALFLQAVLGDSGAITGWWIPVAIAGALILYGINAGLVVTFVSVSTGDRPWAVWKEKGEWLIPYYVVFGLLGAALAAGYLALGVPGILAFVAPPLMMRFALHQYIAKTEQTVLELKRKNAQLEAANRDILQMTNQLTETYDGTLEALVLALDTRDRETKGHSLRVTTYMVTIARMLGVQEESQEWVDMQRGALLHDVGKIGVSDYILHKPGPLTPEEWDDMKRHPAIGYEMLKDISFLSDAAAIVHAHHERFDGKGYPRGLMGDEIPLGSRIFAVADAFDAMTSDRPYRKALPLEVAWQEIIRHSGTQFDPQVVQAFLGAFEELLRQRQASHDSEAQHVRAA